MNSPVLQITTDPSRFQSYLPPPYFNPPDFVQAASRNPTTRHQIHHQPPPTKPNTSSLLPLHISSSLCARLTSALATSRSGGNPPNACICFSNALTLIFRSSVLRCRCVRSSISLSISTGSLSLMVLLALISRRILLTSPDDAVVLETRRWRSCRSKA